LSAKSRHEIPMASISFSPATFQCSIAPPQLLAFTRLPSWTPRVLKRLLWRALNRIIDGVIAPTLNALRGDLGLPPVRNIIRDWWHSPQLVIGLFPQWFGEPQPDWPRDVHLTGFPLYDEPDLTPMSQ